MEKCLTGNVWGNELDEEKEWRNVRRKRADPHLHAAVMICATMINTQADTQTESF